MSLNDTSEEADHEGKKKQAWYYCQENILWNVLVMLA